MAEGNSLYAALQKKDQRRNSHGMRISAVLFLVILSALLTISCGSDRLSVDLRSERRLID